MKITKDVYVTMRDGIRIALKIYRPDADGAFPALFVPSPYQYDTDDLPALPLFLWRETGPIEWYIDHGYAYVRMDVRGSETQGVLGYKMLRYGAKIPRVILRWDGTRLANGDSNVTDGNFAHQYLWYKMGTDTIYHEPEHPSRILLPIVPRKDNKRK